MAGLLIFGPSDFIARENKTRAEELPPSQHILRTDGFERSHGNRVDVLTMHNDGARTGTNLGESILNTSNVNKHSFGRVFARQVDGCILAQLLVASKVSRPGKRAASLVFVATEHNSVYAFVADDPANSAPVWHVNLGDPVPSTDIAEDYHDLTPEIGITGTPVIDSLTRTIYVVAKTRNSRNGSHHQWLHALDIGSGTEKFGGPVEIQATVRGAARDAVDGVVAFNPLRQLNRAALLLSNGIVYIAFGSHADRGPYHGWLLGYDARTLKQVTAFNTTPDGDEGSIWQSGQGPACDPAGNIYVVTGNGTFTANRPGGRDYGQCLLRLSTGNGLQVTGWYSPTDAAEMNRYDIDLGAGGPILIPGTNLVALAGKDGRLRALDRELGQGPAGRNPVSAEFQATLRFLGGLAYWSSPDHGPLVYLWADGDRLKAFEVSKGTVSARPVMWGASTGPIGVSNSAPLSLSAYANTRGTGIIWAACPIGGDANWQPVQGVLRALDASDLSKELWNSKQNEARDDYGLFSRFCPPTIANGKVYIATSSCQLVVYGLLK